MPTYTFQNDEGEYYDIVMSMSELDEYRENHPTHTQTIYAPSIISGRDMSGGAGGHGTDQGWKDVMREMKKNHPKGSIDV
jgi:hypothetical protein